MNIILIITSKLDSKLSSKKRIKFTDIARRIFTSKFNTKVVLEALKERLITKELAQRFEISVQ